MGILEAIILGIVQGLSEFLPISSSGHLEIGKALLGETSKDLTFTIVVHGATVLSTIVVFYKEILEIFSGLLKFKWNESTQYAAKIALTFIPVGVVGFFFKDELEALVAGNLMLVGFMLLITGGLLAFTYFSPGKDNEVSYSNAWWIGLAQSIAVVPGISRSGATIAIALLLGVDKKKAAKFSFLIVLVPVIGANVKEALDGGFSEGSVDGMVLLAGFLAAFVSGVLACRLMIRLVSQGKLIYFAYYCLLVGAIAIITHWL